MIDTRAYTENDFLKYQKRVSSVLPHGADGPTSITLTEEMVDKLEIDWSNPNLRILDPDFTYGSFLFSVYLKLKEFHSDEHIFNNMLFGICRSKGRLLFVKNKLPIKNLFNDDFLNPSPKLKKILNNMKQFDVIVGNPPYQDSENTSTYTNLWSKFVLKSYEMISKNGHMIMVTPKTWATPKNEKRKTDNNLVSKLIQEKSNFVNIDECSKHFDAGSTFSYYHLTKSKPNDKIELMTNTFNGMVDRTHLLFIKDINNLSLSIFKKIKSKGFFKKEKNTSLVGEISDEKTDIHKYRIQYAFTTEKWSDTKHPMQDTLKVIFPNQNSKNYPIFDNGISAPANRGAVYIVENEIQGHNFVNFCKSKLMNFYISQQRFHHGLINTSVISSIPKIDLNKKYSDDEIYKEFNLTQEEINYIENYVG